jgi:hypothetical protein
MEAVIIQILGPNSRWMISQRPKYRGGTNLAVVVLVGRRTSLESRPSAQLTCLLQFAVICLSLRSFGARHSRRFRTGAGILADPSRRQPQEFRFNTRESTAQEVFDTGWSLHSSLCRVRFATISFRRSAFSLSRAAVLSTSGAQASRAALGEEAVPNFFCKGKAA